MILNNIIDEDVKQIIDENNGLNELFDKTILITGASGLIGSYFLYTLIKLNENFDANIKIIPLVRNLNKLDDEILSKNYVFPLVQDVIDEIKYESDVDFVIHAASPASPKLMKEFPVETNFANTLGTANVLKFAKEHEVEKFLFISSREVYGIPYNNLTYFKEENMGIINQLVPRNSYAESKKAAENMCLGFKKEFDLDTKIVRLAHTYGPGTDINNGMVHSDFLKNLLFGKNFVLKSDGSSIRTYTYISDSISAMFKVLLKSQDIVYNIANEYNEVSIKNLAEILISFDLDNNLKLIFDISKSEKDYGYDTFKFCLLSSEKIRNELNWDPKYSVRDGFKRTFEYLQNI